MIHTKATLGIWVNSPLMTFLKVSWSGRPPFSHFRNWIGFWMQNFLLLILHDNLHVTVAQKRLWHDAAGPDPSQVPIFVIFELDMKNNTFYEWWLHVKMVTNKQTTFVESLGPWLLMFVLGKAGRHWQVSFLCRFSIFPRGCVQACLLPNWFRSCYCCCAVLSRAVIRRQREFPCDL